MYPLTLGTGWGESSIAIAIIILGYGVNHYYWLCLMHIILSYGGNHYQMPFATFYNFYEKETKVCDKSITNVTKA